MEEKFAEFPIIQNKIKIEENSLIGEKSKMEIGDVVTNPFQDIHTIQNTIKTETQIHKNVIQSKLKE